MRILAIDPGNTMSAWCIVEHGIPLLWDKEPNGAVRDRIASEAANVVAVEMIASYGMPVGREVFDTCVWIGRFLETWERRSIVTPPAMIYRKDVKLFHCGTSRANDANIRAALIDRYGPGKEKAVGVKKAPGPLYGVKGDCWSALAVALTAAG